MRKKIIRNAVLLIFTLVVTTSCGGGGKQNTSTNTEKAKADMKSPLENKGVGPVSSVVLGNLDSEMAAEGKAIYEAMCLACHKLDQKFIGPAPTGIMKRRSPEWIMNMILNPENMVKQDSVAKRLLMESNLAPMANQNLTYEQARKILEFFRTLD